MTLRNIDHKFFASIEPGEQTWKARLAMDRKHTKISMETYQNITIFYFFKINCSGRQQGTINHPINKIIAFNIQPYSQHFRYSHATIFHMKSPRSQNLLHFWEVLRYNIFCLLQFPTESPISPKSKFKWCYRVVRWFQTHFLFLIVLKFLFILRCKPNLKVSLWRRIDILETLVVLLAPFGKVAHHQILKFIILLLIDSWVSHNDKSILIEIMSKMFAIGLIGTVVSYEVRDINNGQCDLMYCLCNNFGQFLHQCFDLKIILNLKPYFQCKQVIFILDYTIVIFYFYSFITILGQATWTLSYCGNENIIDD